nr:site-specific integrase [Mycobacterium sp. E3298]
MNGLNNVVSLNKDDLLEHIYSFFLGFNGENTKKAYEKDIRMFFRMIKGKEIETMTVTDLPTNLTEMNNFKDLLVKSGDYKNGSINRAISAVKSLYDHLKAHDQYKDMINMYMFKKVKKLPRDTKKTDVLYPYEAMQLADMALDELHNGKEKHVLIKLAMATSIRKDAINKIRFCDIHEHETDKDMYVIESDELFDKGKMVQDKEIHVSLYNLIQELKGSRAETDHIFMMSLSAINDMVKRLCQKAGFAAHRKLSFHSLRKTGIQYAFDVGGLRAAQIQAGHSSPALTSSTYLEKERNIAGRGLFEDLQPETIFDELTKDEAIQLLKGVQNGIGMQLRREAKKIIDARS